MANGNRTVSLKYHLVTVLLLLIVIGALSVQYVRSAGEIGIEPDSFIKSASYVIEKDGSTIKAYSGTTGELAYSGTDASTVIQACIDALTSGKIFIKAGNYTIDTAITIIGSFDDTHPIEEEEKTLIIEGEGMHATRLTTTGSNNIFEIKNSARVIIRNMFIKNPLSSSGHGIYCMSDGAETEVSMKDSVFENLFFYGCDSTHANMYLQNFYGLYVKNIRMNTVGIGIRITSSSSTIYGNGEFHQLRIGTVSNTNTLIHIGASGGTYISDLFFGYVYLQGYYTTPSSNTGLLLEKTAYVKFNHLSVEKCATAIDLQGSVDNEIGLSYIGDWNQDSTGIKCDATTYQNSFHGGAIAESGSYTITAVNDSYATLASANIYRQISLTGTLSVTTSGGSVFRDCYGYVTENSGTAEASNDDYIAHGLAGEPTQVDLTIEETDANYFLQLKATNSSHFQIYLYFLNATACTDDKTINWNVEYQP